MEAEGITYVFFRSLGRPNELRGVILIFGIGRLRLLWGFISVLVILWLLATANNDGPSESMDLQVVKVDHSSSSQAIHTEDSREL